MAFKSDSLLSVELSNWCKEAVIEESHAIMLMGVPATTDVACIEEAVETIKAVGRVRVRDSKKGQSPDTVLILCECREVIDPTRIPAELLRAEGGETWRVIVAPVDVPAFGFSEKLAKFLHQEGKSMTDLESLFHSTSSSAGSPESIIRAVGDLLEKTKPSGDSNAYRRLRMFSGTIPTPSGEENLENWMEQARLMTAECECSEKEKRRRIMESLKGPALDIVKAVRFSSPEASASQYLEALENTFGTSESGEDLYFAFRLLRQFPRESLSDFLRRIEKSLTKVVQKGGLMSHMMDKARIEQLIRGAAFDSDLMLLQLRLRERKDHPPTFLELLNELKTAEENELARRRIGTSVKSINLKTDDNPESEVVKQLRAELQELKANMRDDSAKVPVASMRIDPKEKLEKQRVDTHGESEVKELKKQIHKLNKQLEVMSISSTANAVQTKTRLDYREMPSRHNEKPMKSKEDFFCYRCGEDGHIATKCNAPENTGKVIKKLVRSLRRAKTEGSRAKEDPAVSRGPDCFSKKGLTDVREKECVPMGLVGPVSTISVELNGCPCSALLDSGSQVTIVFEQWHAKYLPQIPIQPLTGLSIWGLSACNYPYKGYILVDVSFPESLIGVKETVPVLALVCPEPQGPQQVPVIIGTNASFFQRLISLGQESGVSDAAHSLRIQSTVSIPCVQHKKWKEEVTDSVEGIVTWMGPGFLTIPQKGEKYADCKVGLKEQVREDILLVEAMDENLLPAGVFVPSSVLYSSDIDVDNFKLLVCNETAKDISIPPGTVMANVFHTDIVTVAQGDQTAVRKLNPNIFNFGDSPIPPNWEERLRKKLSERGNVFSISEWDVGKAKDVTHTIRLNDCTPFRERSRRIAPADIDDVRRHLKDLLAAGIIKESRSPYASPIVIARKKSGAIRMCIDYRTLNSRTVPDQYTTPRIEDALDCLSGSKWFSVLDLRSGYYQIEMAAEDKEKTAFICPLGFYQFERMPQGISGAPATFQRLMERAVGDMHLLQVIVYLDDLIVFGRTLEEHEERLMKVLDRLEEFGLKVSVDKCQFCQPAVKYVGHIVSADGVTPDPEKVKAVNEWKIPHDLKSLRSFLGFCGFYRRFIKNYSKIVRPLTELTKGYAPVRSKQKVVTKGKYYQELEPFGERWTEECTEAFHTIIHCLTHTPVLAYADPSKQYILHVDASLQGLGAVLNQEYPEGLRPIAFASRKLSTAEQRYPIHQLEFLALKWAVVDKFHDYLYGTKFTVRTDNNPLTYVLSSAKLNATGHRWLAALATYDFSLQYKPGSQNTDADVLSRYPLDAGQTTEWIDIPRSGVKAICTRATSTYLSDESTDRLVDQLGVDSESIPDLYVCPIHLGTNSQSSLSNSDLRLAQEQDPVIGPVILDVKKGKLPNASKSSNVLETLLRQQGKKLAIRHQLLYRVTKNSFGKEKEQLVLPDKYRNEVLNSLHDESGHLGIERTTELCKDRFYWPHMTREVEKYVKNCGRCIVRKTLPQKSAYLNHITSSGPMDLVCIDFLSIEPDSKGVANVLVVTDHFTRYAQAYPARDQKALTVAKILVEKFFVHYGLPARIHSDQGRDFESRLIKELLGILGIRKTRTSPYHPQGDPQPERFNRTLLSMLGTLDTAKKERWSQSVSQLVHVYNCTRSEVTGYSPYYLMFGREARLPIDVHFGNPADGKREANHQKYVERMKEDLRHAYKLSLQNAQKTQQRNKRLYDQRVKFRVLEKGDCVLVKNLATTGKQKLQDRWNSLPYLVLEKLQNLPVYRVKPKSGTGGVRTLHRDHLLPIGEEVRINLPAEREEVPRHMVTRSKTVKRTQKKAIRHEVDPESCKCVDITSDSDDSSHCAYYPVEQTVDLGTLSFPSYEREKVKSPTRSQKDPAQVEVTGGDLSHDDDVESVSAQMLENLGDSVSDKEVNESVNVTREEEEGRVENRPKRMTKPVQKLSYDALGKSTDRPLTIIYRGMVVKIQESSKVKSACNTLWCHPMATCEHCVNVHPNLKSEVMLQL